MGIETLTGINKVAVLLICLGEEAAARIFEELSDDEVRQITRAMAEIDHIPTRFSKVNIFLRISSAISGSVCSMASKISPSRLFFMLLRIPTTVSRPPTFF